MKALPHLMTVVLTLLVACGADDELELDDSEELAELNDLVGNGKADGEAWASVGYGVAYTRVNTGDGVLIAYGGYSAKLAYSGAWAVELVNARLGEEGVGHVYAVKGPKDAGYNAREIGNSKLRAHLAENVATDAPIYAVAHSSGAFVAHELLGQLDRARDEATLARIAYANLDGGGTGLGTRIVEALAATLFVYAKDPTLASGRSRNHGSMTSLANAYAPVGQLFEVTVPNTGCANGAGWCLHDVVITHAPHDPWSYDLARDYTDFEGRPVTTEYLEPMIRARD